MDDLLTRTAPENVYLCVSDDADHRSEEFPYNTEDILWCEDEVVVATVKYVRSDLVDSLRADAARYNAEVSATMKIIDSLMRIVEAINRDPHGCPFCDSGKLRRPGVPEKDHNDDCAYKLIRDFDAALRGDK